eukprot:TRINITY_DN1968_c0_g1_i1.p1 TRINITY_DN1968_c0_g1~~TRINITY_DN1968_c0_g1_i1.p1  ORF type:complete len:238 (+),score=84.97 TRINITY_DN1968_c0_g1_i1:34-714(+)
MGSSGSKPNEKEEETYDTYSDTEINENDFIQEKRTPTKKNEVVEENNTKTPTNNQTTSTLNKSQSPTHYSNADVLEPPKGYESRSHSRFSNGNKSPAFQPNQDRGLSVEEIEAMNGYGVHRISPTLQRLNEEIKKKEKEEEERHRPLPNITEKSEEIDDEDFTKGDYLNDNDDEINNDRTSTPVSLVLPSSKPHLSPEDIEIPEATYNTTLTDEDEELMRAILASD